MFWIIRYTTLFDGNKNKILDLPVGSIVKKTGFENKEFSEVSFITRPRSYTGWVYTPYLEELVYQYPDTTVFSQQTPYPYDAAQYIVWDADTLYNLCGEACVAYLFKDTVENFLTAWKAQPASWYNRIIYGGLSKTTGVPDLINMVAIYDGKTENLLVKLYDPLSKTTLVSPARLAKVLENYYCIVSCKISGITGELKSSGILHWIVLKRVVQDGIRRGWVEIWNPFSAKIESYSWREFTEATSPLFGLLIERTP